MADNQQYWPLAPKQTSASDIRKVIANWTKAIGQWSTIATADELKKKEVDKANSNPKVPTNTKKQTTTTKTNTNVVAPKQTNTVSKKPETQWVNKFASLMQGQISGDLFKNPAAQPINDIKVVKQGNEATHNAAPNNNNDISFMNNFGRAKELKDTVNIDNALMDLYSDIKVKVDNWTLASSDVVKMKQAYPEFANIWDDVLLSMIWDMASIANKKMPFNDVNMKKLKSLYPELNSAAWWFDKWNSENMYQAWWIREQMAQSSKTDLNRFWTAWAVAEAAINPIWEWVTLLDMWAQMIPQVDGSWNENRLKKALSKLTDEDINKYYEQYQNYVKNHWTLSKLYTTQLEWDNTVERLWNWATGKGKKDVDAWFREWLIDRVNNEVNWWAWEVTWAANDLKWVWWPNIAKMYANIPASAVKTVTAVTRAITNPIDTAAWLYHLFWTEEWWNALAMRYGSWDWFAKALEQDPVWVASDWLAIVEWWAWLTKMATWWLSRASLLAWLSTEALWAARTTENLLKIATRLENMAVKAGKIEKTAWLASNLWADLPINKVINWLRKWWGSGESMIQKAAKYSANASQTWLWTVAGKAIDEWKKIIKEWPINTIANKLMGSASDTDKLFKAASPNLNKLTNNVNYKNKRQNMDIATQAIVDAWYTPKSMSEWAKAHTETLNKKWNEFKQMVKDKADFEVDVKELLTEVKDYIKREREWATEAQKSDLRKLEVEVNNIERRWKVDMWFIENRKEHYNSSWRDADKLKVWDIYLKWIKLIWNAMRKQQDNILGKWPEQTKKLRKEIAALMDTKEDVIKADVRNQKKKSDIAWGWLVESYWRLSGLWDVVGWILSTPVKWWEWLAQAGKWLGKLVFWKAMWKARDVDYLTKKWFEWLSNKKKAQNNVWWLKNKFQESRELWDMYVERDNLRKELKKNNISDSKKEAINKRLDDIEYAIAQKKARAWLWDKERTLNAESKKKVIDMVSKRAKDVWFTTKVLDWMEKDTQGYTDLRNKLIALEKNPWDTTAQHELFHAFFSVVDKKTKTYILDEAKKILKESWMKDVNAEEWLAESFGIYAKRKQIKLWLIDAPKGFVAKVRDFFQKVYEYMQRFNGDRATINKVFDEVLWDRQMKNWIIDLSDLLGDKEVKVRELWDNWLRNKKVYHGSSAYFDRFDSYHMWEWEWAQAHGWWHYVAVEERTWRHYAEMKYTGKEELKYKGRKQEELYWINTQPHEIAAWNVMNWLQNTSVTFKEAIENSKKYDTDSANYLKNLIDTNKWKDHWYKSIYEVKRLYDRAINTLKSYDNLKESDFTWGKQERNLYNIEIPDPVKADTPTWSNYLEEDGKLTKENINPIIKKLKEEWVEWADRFENSINYHLENWWMTWRDLYWNLSVIKWEKWASKFLESLWYDGIHYFWWRDWEAYVIFNDDALQIKDHLRYKKKIWDKDVEINKDITSSEQMRTLGNNGMIYKTNISDKDSGGKKLSEWQKKFFAGSKVVDKDGNLLRVYHGTRENFTVFDNQKGKFSSNGIAKLWNWFTPSKEWAKQWAKENSLGMKPKAMEWYLDIKNPKIYEKWDATEHLKNVENDRQKLIKDSWKLLDSTWYNKLNKERYKEYFDKDYKHEWFWSKEQEQNKLIEQELKTLEYLSNDYIIEYKSQSYGTDWYQMVKNMREKWLSNEQIIKKANEAKEMLDRLENIRQEHRKWSFTDAYELFENDLRSYWGQTIKDRVWGSWMAMNDEAWAVKKYVEALKEQWYDWIIIKDTEYDWEVFGKTNDQYVAFDSNQFKNIDNKNPTKNEDIRYKKRLQKKSDLTKWQADNIRKQRDKLWNNSQEYKDNLAEQFDEYWRTVDKIEEDTKEMNHDLWIYDEDDYTSSDYYYYDWATFEEWKKQMEADIKANDAVLQKVNEKYNEELRSLVKSLPLDSDTAEMVLNNIQYEWTAWWRALDAFIKGDGEEADKMLKNVVWAYNRHHNTNYDLDRRNNDTSWMDEEQYSQYRKEFNNSVETDYSKTLEDYIKPWLQKKKIWLGKKRTTTFNKHTQKL